MLSVSLNKTYPSFLPLPNVRLLCCRYWPPPQAARARGGRRCQDGPPPCGQALRRQQAQRQRVRRLPPRAHPRPVPERTRLLRGSTHIHAQGATGQEHKGIFIIYLNRPRTQRYFSHLSQQAMHLPFSDTQ